MNIKNKTSIQKNTLIYLISFSSIILLVLWATQILFLKVFYEKYQINSLKKVVKTLTETKHTNEEIENISYKNNICIEYINENNVYIYNSLNKNCILNKKNIGINKLIESFLYGNKTSELIKINDPKYKIKSIIYNLKINENEYIFLNTQLEDVNSTTSVLRSQLIYITLIIIILSILVSIFISKTLNKPLLNITNNAKKLGKEKQIKFETNNIKELDDLVNVLNYANTEITKTDELRRDLLANVSHDLKTPLTMIKAYAEMIKDINIDNKEKEIENLNIIIEETNRLNILVNDILDLSKLEANAENLNIKEFDLVVLLNNIIKKYNIIKETENYKFILDTPKKALVLADMNKISQVIYNLINNAINYTTDSSVTIKIINKQNTFLLEIINFGKCISSNDINLIWNKYYKNEKNHQRNKVGTGIGLSIVKNILEKHNFKYGVKSNIKEGTIFYFEINKNS